MSTRPGVPQSNHVSRRDNLLDGPTEVRERLEYWSESLIDEGATDLLFREVFALRCVCFVVFDYRCDLKVAHIGPEA